MADDLGNLWASTNKGLSRFTPRTGAFRNFSVGDGLQSDEFNRHAYCKDARGTLYFGGVNGINYFDPKELQEDTTPVIVRITDVLLMNKPVSIKAEGSPISALLGIHIGPVVAGIVGVKKFAYDIWGDAVGIAERMESAGEVGRVNISGSTHALVKDGTGLSFNSRGNVRTEEKGGSEMYFVQRSADVLGT